MTSNSYEYEKFTKRSVRSSERFSEKDIRLLSRKQKRVEKRSCVADTAIAGSNYDDLEPSVAYNAYDIEGIAVLGGEYD